MAAPVLMVQGTASSVGKSVLVAGLCRVLRRRGLRVAPFKAQNMSLNAAVTADGLEIARSTAVQAAAAGIEPTVDMNPILLKPEADWKSQVIVRGKVRASLSARDYFRSKADLWPVVAESLDRLRAAYDVVVAEGAGSPAEVNLRDRDIVNMRVAAYARATVLLVGDIDRGGVFAQLVGTLDLLPPDERALVGGLIVNRFRGDPALFADGVRFLEERTGVPVLGIVPFVGDLALPEEDSVALDARHRSEGTEPQTTLPRVAVVRLPRIANFDDFAALERRADLVVRYVDHPRDLAAADLIVVPGSKSTVADLLFLRERGLAEAIVAFRKAGTPVLGICGGFQMLGRSIHDPEGVESMVSQIDGLDLLPVETTFAPEKRMRRVAARMTGAWEPIAATGDREIRAYEIHLGRSRTVDEDTRVRPFAHVAQPDAATIETDGAVSADGLVAGTYLHGLFENPDVCESIATWLAARRGMPTPAAPSARSSHQHDNPYDRWADHLEASLDLSRCFEVVNRPWREDV